MMFHNKIPVCINTFLFLKSIDEEENIPLIRNAKHSIWPSEQFHFLIENLIYKQLRYRITLTNTTFE